MNDMWRARLEQTPRLGWINTPSPLTDVDASSGLLPAGIDRLVFKRDDQLGLDQGLLGGTKLRKLDVLLAAQPWRDAEQWTSVGALGSGHLVTLSSAARRLGRKLRSHLFWEPVLPELLWNLAYVASGPGEMTYSDDRVSLAFRHPGVLVRQKSQGAIVVPPGAATTLADVGVVRGVIELKKQIDAGECAVPDHVFVPIGTGGTMLGIWVGMGLLGLPVTVHGVTAVERMYATELALRRRARRLLALLGAEETKLPPLRIHREALGAGYGVATQASRAACDDFRQADIGLDPIYSGKAMDALRGAAPSMSGVVLFWLTPRKPGPLPADENWRARLPAALRHRLEESDHTTASRAMSRRRVLLGVGASVAAIVLARHIGHPTAPPGVSSLGDWAAHVLFVACEAVIVPTPDANALADMVARVDRFVATQPAEIRWQILGALELVEQMTLPFGGRLSRFTSLDIEGRRAVLSSLAARGGLVAEAGRAVRDLSVLGHYQREASWPALGYAGPWVGRSPRPDPYAELATQTLPPGFEVAR